LIVGAILVFVAGFVGLVVISITLPVSDNQRLSIWLFGFGLLILLVIAGILLWRNRAIRRRMTVVDAAFSPLGLTGKGYLWNGRQYHGLYQGRQVDVYFYRGPSLDIYLAAQLNTRMGVGMKAYLSRLGSKTPGLTELSINDPGFSQLGIYCIDQVWGRALLADARARSIILHMSLPGQGLEFRNLLFQPEAIQFKVHHIYMESIYAENIRASVDGLLYLAGTAESLPAPQVTAVASDMERRARLSRSDYTSLLVGITCGVIGFFTAILIFVVILFLNLGRTGS